MAIAKELKSAGAQSGAIKYAIASAYLRSSAPGESFYHYCRDIIGYRDLYEPFHRPICDFLANPKCHYKMLQACRGSFKSSIGTIAYSTWAIAKEYMETGESKVRILIASEVMTLALNFVKKIRQLMQWRSEYRELFGIHKGDRDWTDTQLTSRFRTDPLVGEPTISATAIDADRSGFHYDIIICDDLETERHSATREQIDRVWDFYRLLHSLLEPDGEMIIISTRWHYDDIYARILERNEAEVRTRRFDTLIVPAKDEKGNLTFPTRYTNEYLDHLRIEQGSYIFSCTPCETPILMADWSLKPISEVEIGDKVIGFKKGGYKQELVATEVLETNSRVAPVQTIILESGKEIRCTPDHQWYTARQDESHRLYKPASVGSRLCHVTDAHTEKAKQILDKFYMKCFIKRKDKVVKIIPGSEEKVYALTTSTGNYVAWGYASKNCQYLLNPVPEESRTFKETWIQYSTTQHFRQPKLNYYVCADLAYTEQRRIDIGEQRKADYTVIMTVAVDETLNYIIVEWFRQRCTKLVAIKEIFRQYFTYNAQVVALQKWDRVLIDEAIKAYGHEYGRLPYINYISYPTKQGKNERIRTSLQPKFEAKKVFLLPNMDWLKEELLDFPRAMYDDGLDALCNLSKVVTPAPATKVEEYTNPILRHIKRLHAGLDVDDEGEAYWKIV